jgi:hypothetical protein
MDKYVKFPASDVASWVGLAVAVIAIVAVARRLPVVSGFVK